MDLSRKRREEEIKEEANESIGMLLLERTESSSICNSTELFCLATILPLFKHEIFKGFSLMKYARRIASVLIYDLT